MFKSHLYIRNLVFTSVPLVLLLTNKARAGFTEIHTICIRLELRPQHKPMYVAHAPSGP